MKLTRKSCLAVLFVMIWVLLSTCLTIPFVGPFAYAQETQTVLKPNQLFTFSLAPEKEKVFVLQMKKGEIADIQWLEAEGSYCAYKIYDPARKELLEESIASQESMWFVAPSDGDFVLVSKLGWEPDNSSSHRISLQYNVLLSLNLRTLGQELHQQELLNDWELLQSGQTPQPIEPLR